jgi:hypothetical protein
LTRRSRFKCHCVFNACFRAVPYDRDHRVKPGDDGVNV